MTKFELSINGSSKLRKADIADDGLMLFSILKVYAACIVGRDSSVGIATHYGLGGPGIESRWGRGFPHSSRPALGPTQPPIQRVPCLSRG